MSSPRTPAPASAFNIPSLDGLRAVSFLLVFLGHTGLSWIPAGFGVTSFFFLSGFLITTLLRTEVTRTGRVDLKLFYLRRVLRIWPPFYLVLGAGVLLVKTGVITAALDPYAVAAQSLHYSNYWIVLHGWGGVVPGSAVYWSLAVEEHFYLLFPALFAALNRAGTSGRRQFEVFGGLCLLVLAWRCVLVLVFKSEVERTYIATDTRIDSILFGCALAVYRNPALDATPRDRPANLDLLLLAAGLGALIFSFAYRDPNFRESYRYTLQGIALCPVFSNAIRFPKWGVFKVLNLRPLRFLGTLSYSLYLVHYTIINALVDHGWALSLKLGVTSFVLSFVIALALWHFVEEPCAEVRRRLSRGRVRAAEVTNAVHTG